MKQGKKVVCTIIAKNYISFARTLFKSVNDQNPDVSCLGLIIDEWRDHIVPTNEAFDIVSLDEVGIPDVEGMAFRYDITELSTAAKPFLLQHLLNERNFDEVLYLDPDILVTGSLSALFLRLAKSDFLITPHLDKDYPDDNFRPDDKFILLAGIYNLGFFGIRRSENSSAFLSWWAHKLSSKCLLEPSIGYFVDQRFIDMALGLFPGFEVVRETAYNAAYWNIHSREVSKVGNQWICNGESLVFFHFSGYNPRKPSVISKYINRSTLESRADLRPLFDEYNSRLVENGFDATFLWSYSFGHFSTGEEILYEDRRFFRKLCKDKVSFGNPFNSLENLDQAERRAARDAISIRAATKIYLGALRQALVGPRKAARKEI